MHSTYRWSLYFFSGFICRERDRDSQEMFTKPLSRNLYKKPFIKNTNKLET